MNKLKKVGLTALGTALVSSTAMAAEFTVTGGANLVFDGGDNRDIGNGWSTSDTLTFSASADLDNGWTVTGTQGLVNGGSDGRTTAIDMGDMGTLTFEANDSGGPVESTDDMMPHANEESWSEVGTVTAAAHGAGDAAGSFKYVNSSLVDGLTFTAFHQPSSAGTGSSEEYGFAYSPEQFEGLTVGYAFGDNEDAGEAATIESENIYATFAYENVTVGYQTNETDSEVAGGDSEFMAYGVSYAITEDLSISLNHSEVEHDTAAEEDQEATAIGVSFTSGGVTVAASHHNVDGVAGSTADSADRTGYEIVFSFAF